MHIHLRIIRSTLQPCASHLPIARHMRNNQAKQREIGICRVPQMYLDSNENNCQDQQVCYLIVSMFGKAQQDDSIHLVTSIFDYKTQHQPIFSDDKKKVIEEKLEREKEAITALRKREAVEDYYVQYNFNPFVQYKPKQLFLIGKDKRNIVNKLVGKDQNKELRQSIQNHSNMFTAQKTKIAMQSERLLNQMEKVQQQKKKGIEPDIPMLNQITKIKKPQQIEDPNIDQKTFESICNIPEKNFFIKSYHKDNINIFKIAHGDDDELSSTEILQKYYFSFNSMYERINKIKIPTFRDMSHMARAIIKNQTVSKLNIIDYVDSVELSFKLKELTFEDVMSVASGRFSPDFLGKMFGDNDQFGNKNGSDVSSEEGEAPIFYRAEQRNNHCDFKNKDQDIQEVIDYKNLKFNQYENDYLHKCNVRKSHIQDQINIKIDLYKQTISDRNLHMDIGQNVKNSISNFVDMDSNKMDLDRLVRKNRMSTDKKEGIRLKTLIETLANKDHSYKMISKK